VLLRKICKGRFEIAISSGIHNNDLQAQRGRRPLQVCDDELGGRRGRVCENANPRSIGYNLAEQLQLFRRQLGREDGGASDVRAGAVEASDKSHRDRVTAGDKDDGYGRSRCLCRQGCEGATRYDHGYAAADELGCKRAEPLNLIVRIPILDRHVLPST
jgi:hypothetical protein